jgi:plastocyanin
MAKGRGQHDQEIEVSLEGFRKGRLLAAIAALCVFGTGASYVAAADASNTIIVKDFMFAPNSLTVKAGSSVTWVNKDDEPHTVVSDSGTFRSAALDTDETFSFKFDKPGTYHFTCSIHPRMVGTITVE